MSTLTGKERAEKRSQANGIKTIVMIGKGGITPMLVTQVDNALTARELIKGRVLETAPESVAATAEILAERTRSHVIQTIGSRFVLYRKNPEKLKPAVLRSPDKKTVIVRKKRGVKIAGRTAKPNTFKKTSADSLPRKHQ